jgi:intein-encoded DNA endonuclease-like protein
MSDYGNSDGWAEKWDKLLYDFIQRNKERLKYIYGMNWIDNYIKKYSDNK